MSGAEFSIDGDAYANLGYDASPSQVLDLVLENTTDVRMVVYSVVQKSAGAPDIVFSPASGQAASPGATVQVTMPASGIHTYIIQAKVNGGTSSDAKLVAAWTKQRAVAIRGAKSSLRKMVPVESTQYHPTEGWSTVINDLVDAVEALTP